MTGLLERPAAAARPAGDVRLRPVTGDDRAAVRGFLAGLSLDSAYRRFFTGLGSPSSTLLRRLVDVDHERREVVLAVLGGGEVVGGEVVGGEVVGLADSSLLADGRTVELGVVVADGWQRRGLGPRLARTVLDLALARGASTVRMHALAENDRVARLVRRAWPDAVPSRDGPVLRWDLAIPLAPPGPDTTGPAARER